MHWPVSQSQLSFLYHITSWAPLELCLQWNMHSHMTQLDVWQSKVIFNSILLHSRKQMCLLFNGDIWAEDTLELSLKLTTYLCNTRLCQRVYNSVNCQLTLTEIMSRTPTLDKDDICKVPLPSGNMSAQKHHVCHLLKHTNTRKYDGQTDDGVIPIYQQSFAHKTKNMAVLRSTILIQTKKPNDCITTPV